MPLTLNDVANNPGKFRIIININGGNKFILRPLEVSDLDKLITFIGHLSTATKTFYSYTRPSKTIATEICQAINKYDKLRFVLEDKNKDIIGMFEFSFNVPSSDIQRFKNYNVNLTSKTDCRLGPVLLDSYQGKGIGSEILPLLDDIAIKYGQNRIILWGGVHTNNLKAVKYFEKNGFKKLGKFTNKDNLECFDMILNLNRSS
jgi:RimJ/RimL family protein N-acetyltransferase